MCWYAELSWFFALELWYMAYIKNTNGNTSKFAFLFIEKVIKPTRLAGIENRLRMRAAVGSLTIFGGQHYQ